MNHGFVLSIKIYVGFNIRKFNENSELINKTKHPTIRAIFLEVNGGYQITEEDVNS